MDAFKLKWIAIIGMILNHIVIGWWEIIPTWLAVPLYAAGGLTFPIMAYFVVEGYKHTSNLKKYLLRLFIFGVIAAFFHPFVFGSIIMNIMFTIIVGIISLVLYDRMKSRSLFWVVFVILCLLTMFPIAFDWSIIGLVVILLTHIIHDEKKRRIVPAVVSGVFMIFFSLLGVLAFSSPYVQEEMEISGMDETLMLVSTTFCIGCFAAALLLKNFNGERGQRMKWIFYIFYPLHLAVIGGVALALGLVDFSVFQLIIL